jgi:phosphoglycerate-specific signal transduction histidine kinase
MTDAQDYKGGADIASMQHIGQRYTQLLEAQARIAELEAHLSNLLSLIAISHDHMMTIDECIAKAKP